MLDAALWAPGLDLEVPDAETRRLLRALEYR